MGALPAGWGDVPCANQLEEAALWVVEEDSVLEDLSGVGEERVPGEKKLPAAKPNPSAMMTAMITGSLMVIRRPRK